jgi:hypothetical protein
MLRTVDGFRRAPIVVQGSSLFLFAWKRRESCPLFPHSSGAAPLLQQVSLGLSFAYFPGNRITPYLWRENRCPKEKHTSKSKGRDEEEDACQSWTRKTKSSIAIFSWSSDIYVTWSLIGVPQQRMEKWIETIICVTSGRHPTRQGKKRSGRMNYL